MDKINFQNLPNTSTAVNADNLNQVQTNVENEFGNYYKLGVGTLIASNTDLNNLTSVGVYYSNSTALTNSLVNCPITDAGFKLIVEYSSTSRIIQTIKVNDAQTSQSWVRTYTGAWGNWVRIAINKPIRTTLFENTNNTNLAITVSESVYDYSYLVVQCDNNNNYRLIIPIYADGQTSFFGVGAWTGNENVGSSHCQGVFSNGGKTITFSYIKSISHNSGGDHSSTTDRVPVRVYGVR